MERVTLHSEGTPLCSFKSAASVPIRSLKAHFTPTQNGSGDPSPSNVREIVGRTSLDICTTEQDLFENVSIKSNCYRDNNGVEHESVNSYYTTTMFDIDDSSDPMLYYMIIHNTASGQSVPVRVYYLTEDGEWIGRIIYEIGGIDANSYGAFNPLNQVGYYPTCRKVQFQFNNAYPIDNFRFIKVSTKTVIFPSSSKNRVDKSTGWTNGCYEENTGRILTNGSGYRDNKYIAVIPGENYTMSWSVYGFNMRVVFYNSDKRVTRTANYSTQTGSTFAVADDEHYIRICQTTNTNYGIPEGLQIEHGSTATTYEAYSSDNTFYGGYVDPVKGVLSSDWEIKVLNGNLSENDIAITVLSGFTQVSYTPYITKGVIGNNFYASTMSNGSGGLYKIYGSSIAPRLFLGLPDTITTKAEAISWFESNPTTIVYRVSSSIEFPLDSNPLMTFDGQNYIFSSSHKKVEADYDLYETRMIQDAKKRSLAYNQPHLESKTGSIVSFTPQVRAPIKELKCEFQPIQDLHGHDYPWPAGGGKNLLDEISYTVISQVAYTDGYFVSETNPTGRYATDVFVRTFLNGSIINTYNKGKNTVTDGSRCSWVLDVDGSFDSFDIGYRMNSNGNDSVRYSVDGLTEGSYVVSMCADIVPRSADILGKFSKIQLEKGTSVTAYSPYENVCPIEGRTNANIYMTGKVIARWNYTISGNNAYSTTVGRSSEAGLAILDILNTLKPGMYNWGMKYETIGTTQARGFRIKYTDATIVNFNMVLRSGSGYAIGSIEIPEDIKNKTVEYIIGYFGQDSEGHVMESASISDLIIVSTNDTPVYGDEYHGAIIPVEFPATKNRLPFIGRTETYVGVDISYDGDCYVLNGTTTNVGNLILSIIPNNRISWNKGDTRYTISVDYVSGSMTIGEGTGITFAVSLFDSSNTKFLRGVTNAESIIGYSGYGYAFDSDGDFRLYLQTWRIGTTFDNLKFRVQIEEGVKSTPYEPYGTMYGGYVDIASGLAVAKWHREILDGSRVYNISNNSYMGTNFTDSWTNLSLASSYSSRNYGLDHLPLIFSNILSACRGDVGSWMYPDNYPWSVTVNISTSIQLHTILGNKEIGAASSDTRTERVAKIKSYLTDHPITIVYELATPIVYQLTPTQLKAFKDQNNIWSDTNGNTTVKYWTH